MKYCCIAGFNILLEGEGGFPYLNNRFDSYVTEPFDHADAVIKLEDVEFIPVPEQRPLAKSPMLRRYYRDSDSYDIYVVEKEENGACSQVHSNLAWSEISVKTSSKHITGIEVDFYTFQILWDAVRNFIIARGGIVIHSSAISYKGQGILFSAPSGTGKSTHTQLWQRLYPDSVEIVNDDTPAIFFRDDVPYMYGLPWSGKGENKNMSVPLKSVVFLERSKQNVIRLSDVDSAVFNLLGQTYRSVYEENVDRVLEKIERLINSIDIYQIGVNMEEDAAVMVKNTVFGV